MLNKGKIIHVDFVSTKASKLIKKNGEIQRVFPIMIHEVDENGFVKATRFIKRPAMWFKDPLAK